MKCMYCGADINPSDSVCPYCGAPTNTIFSDALPIGTKLNKKYKVEKVLGQGGFGITYLGSDNLLKRRVAIKEFFPSGCLRNRTTVIPNSITKAVFDDMKEKFIEEAKILAMMNHPGIVKVYDYFEDNNTAYIIMEYLEGESLRGILNKKGRMEEKEVREYALKICEALKEVHEKNYLHRDLKPENVIVTKDGRVVLIDFGAAREYAEGKTVSHTQILTPGYAPLEQYTKQAKRGPYTDIYALGAMMYEMLTGEIPPSAPDRVAGVELEDIRNKVNVDKNIAEVLMKCLALNAKDRYQNVDDLIQSLHNSNPTKGYLPKLKQFIKTFRAHSLQEYNPLFSFLNILLMFILYTWLGKPDLTFKKAIFLGLASFLISKIFLEQSNNIDEESFRKIFFVDIIFMISLFVSGLIASIKSSFVTFLVSVGLISLHTALNVFVQKHFKSFLSDSGILIAVILTGISFLIKLGWIALVFWIIFLRFFLNNNQKFGGLLILEIIILIFSSSKFFYFSEGAIGAFILFFVLEIIRYFIC